MRIYSRPRGAQRCARPGRQNRLLRNSRKTGAPRRSGSAEFLSCRAAREDAPFAFLRNSRKTGAPRRSGSAEFLSCMAARLPDRFARRALQNDLEGSRYIDGQDEVHSPSAIGEAGAKAQTAIRSAGNCVALLLREPERAIGSCRKTPAGSLEAVGTGYSVIAPNVVMRPILLPSPSVNHSAPSDPS
jgi:hypothetical protein